MKKLDKRTEFERQWEEAFKEAEMSPPEGLWDKIDAGLSRDEAGYFKKRAFLFKMLAAASVVFALGVGLFSLNYYTNQNPQSLITESSEKVDGMTNKGSQDTVIERDQVENGEVISGSNESALSESFENSIDPQITKSDKSGITQSNNALANNSKSHEEDLTFFTSDDNVSVSPLTEETLITDSEQVRENEYFGFNELTSFGVISKITDEDIYVIDHIYSIPIMPRGASKIKKEKETGVYLAGLDFSTGRFDPNFRQGQSLFASTGYSAVSDARVESVNDKLASFNTSSKDFLLVRSAGQENKPQIALSYGANVGFKITNRIVIQTGLAYRKASTSISTTGYIEEAGSDSKIPIVASHQYQFGNLSAVSRIPETSLQNQYEFASIPLETGYIVLDKKVNVTLLAGISSEFFLNNKITDDSNLLETISNSNEDASPYKSVYFNGTLGTMLGYSFAEKYQIMIEPSYRFAVNSFTKDEFYLNSYPSSFMFTFGVAYNFK
jgi:hypothetical protein